MRPMLSQRNYLQEDFEEHCSPSGKRYVKANLAVFCASFVLLILGAAFFALKRCQSRQASGEDFKDACRIGLGFMATSCLFMAVSVPVIVIACIGGFFSCKKRPVSAPEQVALANSIQNP